MRSKKKADPFYNSKAWHRIRTKVLMRDHHRCVICNADVRGKGKFRVDHILPRKKFPELALHMPNLRTLCVPCDMARHNWDRTLHNEGVQTPVGDDGFPVGSDWSS